ncbi:hypothetical protein Q8A73_006921 [Channa argus]|nr:hypothetical protein Q8A73_006921 [Channa argus]
MVKFLEECAKCGGDRRKGCVSELYCLLIVERMQSKRIKGFYFELGDRRSCFSAAASEFTEEGADGELAEEEVAVVHLLKQTGSVSALLSTWRRPAYKQPSCGSALTHTLLLSFDLNS